MNDSNELPGLTTWTEDSTEAILGRLMHSHTPTSTRMKATRTSVRFSVETARQRCYPTRIATRILTRILTQTCFRMPTRILTRILPTRICRLRCADSAAGAWWWTRRTWWVRRTRLGYADSDANSDTDSDGRCVVVDEAHMVGEARTTRI